ncbi:hypothetical protein FSP39_011882 [Pinctada imbricata]|uniref:Ubiquitin-like modifier-activating enzyme ATG7 n=1 Tax=Pinctada imbricata TaxID=66713 RepID=A0AA89C1H2_PINIB|nr:hypothetical protein FSP39_011882 [Pinctada imbricata]
MCGILRNTNTIDQFKELDKKQFINQLGHQDLKKYVYYYWCAFPCLCPAEEFTLNSPPVSLGNSWNSQQTKDFLTEYDRFQTSQGQYTGYFLVVLSAEGFKVDSLSSFSQVNVENSKVYFGFADPCTLDVHPGWPLRNYLMLIGYHCAHLQNIDVLCLRDRSKDGVRDVSHSLLMSVRMSNVRDLQECPKCVGWEKNEKGKLLPRVVDLSASMDPTRLAESAVDLNLKLMRWRLIPELNLEKISQTKCLLLGAGTLGCNVARCLLGWGIKNLTLVDNGKISYSNPVRQSLFVFEDCMKGGKPKAETAAEALKSIFPGVNARGVSLSIPMPGHAVPDSSVNLVKKDVEVLDELVNAHDAIFLLLDTRESRWLPTVMAAAKRKIVICSALGFDTFLVMRHGVKTKSSSQTPQKLSMDMVIPGDQLGCYFCNDVVAPGNSTKDRTLDQQCTVSRPGMSYMASAMAAELLVSVLQHDEGALAPADTSAKEENLTKDLPCALGLIPHQIRCFLSRFHQVLPACRAFDKCTACSDMVVNSFKKDGFEFLLKAFNNPSFLEDLTGLTQMHQETMDAEVWGFSDDEECSSIEMT